ncbi:hypothetical protein [Sporosarcina sp. HYO08]|uniref:hypothetical protein n=1 Tax=Sporosarcina sp. HYO08 TaxID=1759557 RepID=UPI000795DA6F|nr:hypothetical protein [Sporosarcina sp. HYO08]KXH79764.1 hypothetical protein AU377_09755 [Sporosarcina sp. HYO08]
MGIYCPCGVNVNATAQYRFVTFTHYNWPVEGDLTYLADVKITNLDKSTLSLNFVDTETPNDHSFTFTANRIASVKCQPFGACCVITVIGTGLVNGQEYSFEAVFRDEGRAPGDDSVISFVITDFFDQNGRTKITSGSIEAIGCQSCS